MSLDFDITFFYKFMCDINKNKTLKQVEYYLFYNFIQRGIHSFIKNFLAKETNLVVVVVVCFYSHPKKTIDNN